MYFDAPCFFIGFFQKHGIAGALQHHVCQISYRIYVSFYRLEMKIQPELRSIENLNPSSVVNDEDVDLATRNVM